MGGGPLHVRLRPRRCEGDLGKWTALCQKHGVAVPQAALSFAFLPEIVDFVAFGTSRAQAVDENVALCGKAVPAELWAEAREAGLIDARLPLPKVEA